jgi:hypothetical protein
VKHGCDGQRTEVRTIYAPHRVCVIPMKRHPNQRNNISENPAARTVRLVQQPVLQASESDLSRSLDGRGRGLRSASYLAPWTLCAHSRGLEAAQMQPSIPSAGKTVGRLLRGPVERLDHRAANPSIQSWAASKRQRRKRRSSICGLGSRAVVPMGPTERPDEFADIGLNLHGAAQGAGRYALGFVVLFKGFVDPDDRWVLATTDLLGDQTNRCPRQALGSSALVALIGHPRVIDEQSTSDCARAAEAPYQNELQTESSSCSSHRK